MKDICFQILNAQCEGEVHEILTKDYFKRGSWKPLGDIVGNYNVVENQQAHPVASLVEKTTNATDAILLKECKLRNIDPRGEEAPRSMDEAIEDFFVNDKDKQGLIEIKSDGSKTNPNLTIIDCGEGQRPEDFQETFLGLVRSKSKLGISFVQGRYHMGGSGVLPFCGEYGYELILSRSAILGGTWGWTIIRRNREAEQYEYFVHKGQIPSFEIREIEGKENGTFIKLFNYGLLHPSTITTDLRNDLDLFMFETPLPIQLIETRSELSPAVPKISTWGNRNKIKKELLDPTYQMPLIIEADFGRYGKRKLEIYIFKADGDLESGNKKTKGRLTSPEKCIFLTINGQTHATFPRRFISNDCGRKLLAKDILIHIDFSGIGGADRVDIFKPSRDSMKENIASHELVETIRKCISEDPTLKELNEIRFRKSIEKTKVGNLKTVNLLFTQLIDKNPSIRKYFKLGGKVVYTPELGKKIKDDFKPPYYPTTLQIKGWNDKKGVYTKEIPIDSTGTQMSFTLNAPDDYFDRSTSPGTLVVTPTDMLVRRKLLSGTLDLKFIPTLNAKVGETHIAILIVSRYTQEALVLKFQVKYIPPPLSTPQPSKTTSPPQPPKVADLGLPEIRDITKDKWGEEWTGEDIVKIMDTGDDSDTSKIIICVNMDANDYHEYIFKNRIMDDSKRNNVLQIYRLHIVVNSFVLYMGLKEKYKSLKDIPSINELVSENMKCLAKILLDLQLNDEILKILTAE